MALCRQAAHDNCIGRINKSRRKNNPACAGA
jgi:hypothetical protein